MKPEAWQPGTVDAIATSSANGRRIVIKTVNYDGVAHTTLVRLHGTRAPVDATVTRFTVSANPNEAATLQQPNRIVPVMTSMPYAKDLTIDLPAYSVAVVEIAAR
jgi:alpha-N-arabinofuranosidase